MTAYGAALYKNLNTQTSVIDADPHRLIQLLFEGALERLASAKGYLERKDFGAKSKKLSEVMNILGGLQKFLDHEQGGEIAANLDRLYDYMIRRLFKANIDNDVAMMDEVAHLIITIKSGWDGIRSEVLQSAAA